MSDEFASALELALRGLRASDRYESEVRDSLRAFAPAIVDRVVERLKERGLLNDARTTHEAVVRNSGRRAVGDERLREKLARRGAGEELTHRVLAEAAVGESERAQMVLAAKFPDRTPEDRLRAGRFLGSRGFAGETIEAALNAAFGELTDRTASDVFIE